jgi:hypothetical protein
MTIGQREERRRLRAVLLPDRGQPTMTGWPRRGNADRSLVHPASPLQTIGTRSDVSFQTQRQTRPRDEVAVGDDADDPLLVVDLRNRVTTLAQGR